MRSLIAFWLVANVATAQAPALVPLLRLGSTLYVVLGHDPGPTRGATRTLEHRVSLTPLEDPARGEHVRLLSDGASCDGVLGARVRLAQIGESETDCGSRVAAPVEGCAMENPMLAILHPREPTPLAAMPISDRAASSALSSARAAILRMQRDVEPQWERGARAWRSGAEVYVFAWQTNCDRNPESEDPNMGCGTLAAVLARSRAGARPEIILARRADYPSDMSNMGGQQDFGPLVDWDSDGQAELVDFVGSMGGRRTRVIAPSDQPHGRVQWESTIEFDCDI